MKDVIGIVGVAAVVDLTEIEAQIVTKAEIVEAVAILLAVRQNTGLSLRI